MRLFPHLYFRFVMAAIISLALTSCNTTDKRNELYQNEERGRVYDVEKQSENHALRHTGKVQMRIVALTKLVESSINELDKWHESSPNISESGRLRLQELRKDLVHINNELGHSLDSLEKVGDEQYNTHCERLENKIDRSRDELEQINEELTEWREDNLD